MKVFISYSRTDQDAAEHIANNLREHGADVFVDTQRLTAGEDFIGRLGQEIESCDVLVLLLSPASVESKWVRAEVSWAFTKDKRIVPMLLEETNLTDFFFLANVDRIDFKQWGINRHVEEPLRKLARSLGLADTPGEASPPPPAIPAFNLAELNRRMKELETISEELRYLASSPLYQYRIENNYYPVPGEGSPFATIMMIGEAPGENEAISGRPFVGASGQILDDMLKSIGLQRENIFMTNIVKDRLPDNRDPLPEEIEVYVPHLNRQLDVIKPSVIVTLGRYAMYFILEKYGLAKTNQKISKLRGTVIKATAPYGPISIVPLYHPAVALYRPPERQKMHNDFQVLRQFL